MMAVRKNKNNMLSDFELKSTDGVIDACRDCSGLHCCGICSEGGVIEPPYLARYDIEKIEYFTGLKKEQFANEKKNPVTGNTMFTIKTKENEGCLFFDEEYGKCRIHSYRPMDCRLFPLDIRMREGNYCWALFKYKRCRIKKHDIISLLEFRDKALLILGDELRDYATYPVPGMEKIGYKILKNYIIQKHETAINNSKTRIC